MGRLLSADNKEGSMEASVSLLPDILHSSPITVKQPTPTQAAGRRGRDKQYSF